MSNRPSFTRSRDKMVAGICSSIAKQTKIDANIVRLIVIVLTFVTSGVAALIYAIAWAALPVEGETRTHLDSAVDKGKAAYQDYQAKKSAPSSQPGSAPQQPTETFDPYSER